MSKMLGMHILELKPETSVEDFEQFGRDVIPTYVFTTPGYSGVSYKGVKGERIDKYIQVFHMEGDEARKRYFFSDEEQEAFYKQNDEKYPHNPKVPQKLQTLVDGFFETFTDYDCIASTAQYQTEESDVTPNFIRFHKLTLKTNVTPDQFETFCKDVWSKTGWVEGETCYVMKGIKGGRIDDYAFVITVEGQTAQDLIMGDEEEYEAAWAKVFEENPQNQPAMDGLHKLSTGFGITYTNYIALSARV